MSVVGIDLGTTNTVVGCVRNGKVHVLADEKGQRLLPSVVSFHPNGEILVGAVAKARRIIDPRNTIYSHKRLIGRSWTSPEITQARNRFAFELREGPGQGPLIHARNQDYTLPEISAFVLKRARQIAEAALGGPVERAVITVPAHFNELQRASTKVAGRVSGLEVLRILNEPTAAALAYGLGRSGSERVAVYDFGGGTFDCTLLDLNGNVFEVLATAGDSFLGGDDIDGLIADRMAEVFLKQHRQDAREDPQLFERLKTTAEEIKIALSTAETHTALLRDFGHGPGGAGLNFQFTLSRKELEALITPTVERTFKVTQDALALARLSPSSFDKVILVGGSTRVPLVRKRVEAFFGGPPMDRVNPDEVVAIGAAIQAAALTEGIRRRSIPAPPGVPKRQSQQDDTQDNTQTQTNQLDPASLKPAFGSEPPAFGFSSAAGSHPPAFASTVGSTPPQTATGTNTSPAPAASSPPPHAVPTPPPPMPPTGQAFRPLAAGAPPAGVSRQTRPGVAPATQPLGARPPVPPPGKPAPGKPADREDPSFASFPELNASKPVEWFPSGQSARGAPPTGETAARKPPAPSERTFGGDARTVTKAMDVGPSIATPREPEPMRPLTGNADSFGAIDEPPSLVSTSTASAAAPGMKVPSPVGGDTFGAVQDLSLVSSSGVSSSAVSPTSSDENPFGHVADLSLISTTGTATAAVPHPPTGPGHTVQLDPKANPAAAKPAPRTAPSVMPRDSAGRADLPSVAPKAKPARHQAAAQVGMRPDGTPSMMGKAPPLVAPQPFGPMERIDREEPPPHARAMQQAPPPPPLAQTAPLAPTGAHAGAHAGGPQVERPFGVSAAVGGPQVERPFGVSAAVGGPQVQPFGGPPPQPMPARRPGAPPVPHAPPPAAAPPPPANNPFSFGSAPPGPSQSSAPPPAFGGFGSHAPDGTLPLDGGAHAPDVTPPMPAAPKPAIQYQSPVLVDVTPRALIVETAGGYTDTIIPRNSKIPCERTRRFTTGRDMQTTVRVRVGQGESAAFGQNTFLGEVELSGLRPAPRGDVTVAVTFEVDADGTVRVRARDVQTGQEARATLHLVGVADESSVVMMINRFAQQPVVGGSN